jgi:CDP-diglyceride synthetase
LRRHPAAWWGHLIEGHVEGHGGMMDRADSLVLRRPGVLSHGPLFWTV